MKKNTLLFTALVLLGFNTTFAGDPAEKPKAQFQFTAADLTQNSWDYTLLHYNVTDLNTGESLNIPSFLLHYEVKDKAGKLVADGSGLYLNVKDAQLGSEEDYTVEISTMINGQKVSHDIQRKASPKKLAMKVDVNGANIASGALANNDFSYSVTRPKFNHPDQTENVNITPSDVELNIALNGNVYKIDAGANHPKVTDQTAYQALKNDLEKLTAEGKSAQMSIEPKLIFKGEIYTDNQSLYDVTASGISEVRSDEAVADK